LITSWTFDAFGDSANIHATVRKVPTGYSLLWVICNHAGEMLDSGASRRSSPEEAIIHLRAMAVSFGIEDADTVGLRAFDPGWRSAP
jgi:hypothetical protein